MGARHLFGMEPPVISCGKFKGQLIILVVVFSHINIVSIAGNIVEGFGFHLHFGTFFVSVVALYIAVFHQLFLDLGKVALLSGNVQGIGDGFQMFDLAGGVCNLNLQSFLSTFQLTVTIEILLGILLRSQGRIKRNGDFFSIIIVHSLKGFTAFFQTVAVGVDQFAVNLVFVLFLSVFHLLLLKA